MPQQNPQSPADQAQDNRLDQELAENVTGPRSDGHAQPDLARSLGHRDQHDVHDPDAADDQRDQSHAKQQIGHQSCRLRERIAHLGHVPDSEIVRLAGTNVMTLTQHVGDLLTAAGISAVLRAAVRI